MPGFAVGSQAAIGARSAKVDTGFASAIKLAQIA
jgi:hypothetical protein